MFTPEFKEGNLIISGKLIPIKFNGTQLLNVKSQATLRTDNSEIRFLDNNYIVNADYVRFPWIDFSIGDLHLEFAKEFQKNFSKVICNKEDFNEISDGFEDLQKELEKKIEEKEERRLIIAIIMLGAATIYLFRNMLLNIIVEKIEPAPEEPRLDA